MRNSADNAPESSMLEINNLYVRYGRQEVLRDLSFTLEDGRIHALIGHSGCGKSTLLKVLCGIRRPEAGSLLYRGAPLSGAPGAGISIGYVPQNYGLLPWKTLQQNIFLPQNVGPRKNRSPSHRSTEAEEVIEALGLRPILHRYPREVSGGQQQRAALARALSMRPDLLLMDEPFSALDAITAAASRELFLRLWQKRRITTLFITHSMSEAAEIGQKILVLGPAGPGFFACLDNATGGQISNDHAAMSAREGLIAAMSAALALSVAQPPVASARRQL